MRQAIEGKEYTVNKDGKFNIRHGGSYVKKKGKLFVIEPVDKLTDKSPGLVEDRKNEIQK